MSNSGVVLSIDRCALHDGPGIRTVVFLKGCPLHCLWCHNPEAQSHRQEIGYDSARCVGCGACAAICGQGCHKLDAGGHSFLRGGCTSCGACIRQCRRGCLKVYGGKMTALEVIVEALRDRDYYVASGGGLTLSGGEPLAQLEFAKALLMSAKAEGIHTCVETCGAAPRACFEEIRQYTDLFLYDYKATDPYKHWELTGMGNDGILENLDALCRNGANVLLRCPLVPGVNDDVGHLRGIAAIVEKYPMLQGVELMPYHNAGRGKYRLLGKEQPYPRLPSADGDIMQAWLKRLYDLGCRNVKAG